MEQTKFKIEQFNMELFKKNVWTITFSIENKEGYSYLAKDADNNWAINRLNPDFIYSLPFYVEGKELEEKLIQLVRLRVLAKGHVFRGTYRVLPHSTTYSFIQRAKGRYYL
jgi:hypothetical protein